MNVTRRIPLTDILKLRSQLCLRSTQEEKRLSKMTKEEKEAADLRSYITDLEEQLEDAANLERSASNLHASKVEDLRRSSLAFADEDYRGVALHA